MRPGAGHLQCPFCNAYGACRLYIASANIDTCHCTACGADWDEDAGSGAYLGRAHRRWVLL
ncbi:MAG: hypothetical protein ACRD0F_10735, partial [Acidimicrobiales bacterium]